SEAFAGNPPQVFEITKDAPVHALANSWEIGPVPQAQVGGLQNQAGGTQTQTGTPAAGLTKQDSFLFETSGFGLAPGRLVLFEVGEDRFVERVAAVSTFAGKDGKVYAKVELDQTGSGGVTIPSDTKVSDVKVLTPTVSAVLTNNKLPDE